MIAPSATLHRRWLRAAERNALTYRRSLLVFLTGLLEPILFLGSIGIGVGGLVDAVPAHGRLLAYDEFVAPGLLAAAAMNGAVFDTTFNFYIKVKYAKIVDAALATPLEPRDVAIGEVAWALARGGFYSAAFLASMVVLGLVASPWAVLALPSALLMAAAAAATGLAATTYMRSWTDFDLVTLVITPLFLFSATFFPLARYPDGLEPVVALTPLYQGVELCRSLVIGDVRWVLVLHAGYLALMTIAGVRVAGRRIDLLLRT